MDSTKAGKDRWFGLKLGLGVGLVAGIVTVLLKVMFGFQLAPGMIGVAAAIVVILMLRSSDEEGTQ